MAVRSCSAAGNVGEFSTRSGRRPDVAEVEFQERDFPMPLSRTVLERQIEQAKTELSAWVEELKKSGLEKPGFRANPKWRTLNAKCNQIQRRLNSLAKTEAVDAEAVKLKAEKEAAVG